MRTTHAPARGVGFAIPSSRVEFIVPQLIQSGKVTDSGLGDLGIERTIVNAQLAAKNQFPVNQGVLISKVTSSGPADQAGLKVLRRSDHFQPGLHIQKTSNIFNLRLKSFV